MNGCVVRIGPHHLHGGGARSWVDIGPHPSVEGRDKDAGDSGRGGDDSGGGWVEVRTMINIVDLRSAASGKHPIGWETRAALVPLPNVVVVDGREGIDIARS